MPKTQYYCASTLDGYIAEVDDTLGWLLEYEGSFEGDGVEPIKGSYERFYEGVGALIMGSVTYRWILGHMGEDGEWPYKGKPTWVLSSRDLPQPAGEGVDVRIVEAKVPDLHAELIAAAEGRNLLGETAHPEVDVIDRSAEDLQWGLQFRIRCDLGEARHAR